MFSVVLVELLLDLLLLLLLLFEVVLVVVEFWVVGGGVYGLGSGFRFFVREGCVFFSEEELFFIEVNGLFLNCFCAVFSMGF